MNPNIMKSAVTGHTTKLILTLAEILNNEEIAEMTESYFVGRAMQISKGTLNPNTVKEYYYKLIKEHTN